MPHSFNLYILDIQIPRPHFADKGVGMHYNDTRKRDRQNGGNKLE